MELPFCYWLSSLWMLSEALLRVGVSILFRVNCLAVQKLWMVFVLFFLWDNYRFSIICNITFFAVSLFKQLLWCIKLVSVEFQIKCFTTSFFWSICKNSTSSLGFDRPWNSHGKSTRSAVIQKQGQGCFFKLHSSSLQKYIMSSYQMFQLDKTSFLRFC